MRTDKDRKRTLIKNRTKGGGRMSKHKTLTTGSPCGPGVPFESAKSKHSSMESTELAHAKPMK